MYPATTAGPSTTSLLTPSDPLIQLAGRADRSLSDWTACALAHSRAGKSHPTHRRPSGRCTGLNPNTFLRASRLTPEAPSSTRPSFLFVALSVPSSTTELHPHVVLDAAADSVVSLRQHCQCRHPLVRVLLAPCGKYQACARSLLLPSTRTRLITAVRGHDASCSSLLERRPAIALHWRSFWTFTV